ncbi:hypothetical protein [Thalassotalea maritima]|uniref:hypothetical protein n=1 Tax=Thalassotalea maritima TaxID=3242416 RepID=UPI003526EB22
MMKIRLSFAQVIIHSDHLAEVIVDHNVLVTLEMCERLDQLWVETFDKPFALLINRINHYSLTYEAKLSIASLEQQVATAIVIYHCQGANDANKFIASRRADNLNVRQFDGLQQGYQQAFTWLDSQLELISEPYYRD